MGTTSISEADILKELIAPDVPELPAEAARSILTLRFSDSAQERVRHLLDLNNAGTITSDEEDELQKYLRVGQFLDLFQAKARASLVESHRS